MSLRWPSFTCPDRPQTGKAPSHSLSVTVAPFRAWRGSQRAVDEATIASHPVRNARTLPCRGQWIRKSEVLGLHRGTCEVESSPHRSHGSINNRHPTAKDPLIFHGLIGRVLARLPLVASAAMVAVAIVVGSDHPVMSVLLLLGAGGVFLPSVVARVRFRRLLLSGDVQRVLAAWRGSFPGTKQAEEAEPMMSAILFAAYGWVDQAREHLHRARFKSEANLAREHLLFVETLVEAFDGDRVHAMETAHAIAALPMPNVGGRLQRKVLLLRASLGALARAFAHRARKGDLEILENMAQTSPLVSWSMRYAAAIVALDENQPERARALIANAPDWPDESAFKAFQAELLSALRSANSDG